MLNYKYVNTPCRKSQRILLTSTYQDFTIDKQYAHVFDYRQNVHVFD